MSATFDSLGMCFDPTLALLNHSCSPNAAIVFDGNFASIRSTRDIAQGEQVTISYIDNTYKRSTRRGQLRTGYFFECQCPGCVPPANKFLTRDSFLCENPKCKSLIPEPGLPSIFTCPNCNTAQSIALDSLRSLEIKALQALEKSSLPSQPISSLLNNTLLPTLASLTSCPQWPPLRQPAPALRRQIYQLALDTANYEAAFHHANVLSSPPLIDLHPEPFHPLRTVGVFTTATLISLLAAQENNVEYLKRAWELLKASWVLVTGSHGESSEFARRVAAKRGEVEADLSMGGEDLRRWMRMQSEIAAS